ncbi:MAG: methyltransferase [Chitinophagaceae bacterium]
MANSYFRFKQFTIHQEQCAMKVTTDGCLFGAWCAAEAQNLHLPAAHTLLDIGGGTGLLSLMYAQLHSGASMHAVEYDPAAAIQATKNANESLWADRIAIFQQDIKTFRPEVKYDVIISNPPFYEQQWQGPQAKKNAAHHSTELSLDQLFEAVGRLLQPGGYFLVLLPWYRCEEAIRLAEVRSLFVANTVAVRQTPAHDFFRCMLLFEREQPATAIKSELVVEQDSRRYSEAFTALLKDYYLNL